MMIYHQHKIMFLPKEYTGVSVFDNVFVKLKKLKLKLLLKQKIFIMRLENCVLD